jgi:signal peptidase I
VKAVFFLENGILAGPGSGRSFRNLVFRKTSGFSVVSGGGFSTGGTNRLDNVQAPIIDAEQGSAGESSSATAPRASHPSTHRQVAEFLVVLITGILLFRTFAAEAYVVPTGSMAPTLLGLHRDYRCPNCHFGFALGMDDQGRSGRPVCPNCGNAEWKGSDGVENNGDRLLVQKFLYDLRPPVRWEAAVFQNPLDLSQAYVKRVVGLPGESILIRGGDIEIDGRIARKTLAEQRALRVPVYNNEFVPSDASRYPRLVFRHGGFGRSTRSGWEPRPGGFFHRAIADAPDQVDWLEYRHWQPDRGSYGPVRDYNPYNGIDLPGEHRVDDLMIEAEIAPSPALRAVVVRLSNRADHFLATIPVDQKGSLEVRRNGRKLNLVPTNAVLRSSPPDSAKFVRLEASVMDRRLTVALDGQLLFEPFDYDDPAIGPVTYASPVALGVLGTGRAAVGRIRIDRDLYYTEVLANAPRRPFAVGSAYLLGPNEFFVLGDNSPVSNDSRFWPGSPVVRREMFLGKPFLVHLPSRGIHLQVFGRELYWIPDPREIRYIR